MSNVFRGPVTPHRAMKKLDAYLDRVFTRAHVLNDVQRSLESHDKYKKEGKKLLELNKNFERAINALDAFYVRVGKK